MLYKCTHMAAVGVKGLNSSPDNSIIDAVRMKGIEEEEETEQIASESDRQSSVASTQEGKAARNVRMCHSL